MSPRPTLHAIVDALGSVVLEVEAAGAGLGVPVGEVVIHDPLGPAVVVAGDLILAVGVGGNEPRAVEIIRHAAQVGAGGVVLRGPVPAEFASVGESAGVAVLSAAPEVSWGHLYALLRTAIGTVGLALGDGEGAPAGDLFALSNAVAAMVGCAVTIEDPQSRVLAFSNLGHPIDEPRRQTILGRRVPLEWVERLRDDGLFSRLWTTDDVVVYDGVDQRRLAIAIRAGDQILGSIWAVLDAESSEEAAYDAMREAAAMAALHLVRHRMGEDLERQMRGELLRSLLDGRGSVDVIAQRLGTESAIPVTLMAFELVGDDDAVMALSRDRVRELVVTYCDSFRRRLADVTIDRILYVLLLPGSSTTSDGERFAGRLAEDVVRRAEALGIHARSAVGPTVTHLRGVPASRDEVERVLEVFARYRLARRVAHVDDVRTYAILLELESIVLDRPHMRLRELEDLGALDEEQGTPYLETLRAYLDAFGDVAQAAKATHVHPNTFRYRLRRLVELSGLDLQNPDERIAVEILLRSR